MSKMPDKYDEVAKNIQALYHQGVYVGETEKISAILRSAFPETPPAEDARRLREKIMELYRTPFMALDWEKMTDAEIESFAQSRVEPWREAAKAMCDSYKQGHDCGDWGNWDLEQDMPYVNLRALLSDSPAKEAEK